MSLRQDQHSIEQMSTGDHSIIPRPEDIDLAQYDVGLSLVDEAAKALTYYSQQHTTLDSTAQFTRYPASRQEHSDTKIAVMSGPKSLKMTTVILTYMAVNSRAVLKP